MKDEDNNSLVQVNAGSWPLKKVLFLRFLVATSPLLIGGDMNNQSKFSTSLVLQVLDRRFPT